MMNMLQIILYILGVAVLIGVIVSIPVFILALGMSLAARFSGKKKDYTNEEIGVFKEINDELEQVIKDYNIKDEKTKDKILNELIKSKGYKFENDRLVKL